LTGTSGQTSSPATYGQLNTIRTLILVALVFNILAIIGYVIALVILGVAASAAPPAAAVLGAFIFIDIVFLIVAVLVMTHAWSMYSAAERGDIAALKSLNSLGWDIAALIFSGIVPGVLLLVAYGSVQDLPAAIAMPS
jgi:dolichyl-phosphate-mannose--protein O-mannosyl transferase